MQMQERTQYLFIDSAKCLGEPYDFSFHLPSHAIKCDGKKERLRISLIKWTCRHDWYVIRSPYNYFICRYNGVNISMTIPEGNYTYTDLALKLKELLNANKASLGESGTINVSYSPITNKFKFTFSTPSSVRYLQFPVEKCNCFGFTSGVLYAMNTVLNSEVPINFYGEDERLLIYLDGIHAENGKSLTHQADNKLNDHGTILASVLVNNEPFETLVYEDDGTLYGHYISERALIGHLKIRILTTAGINADFVPHSHIVLRVDVIKNDKQREINLMNHLENIEDYVKLLLISQNIGGNNLPPSNEKITS